MAKLRNATTIRPTQRGASVGSVPSIRPIVTPSATAPRAMSTDSLAAVIVRAKTSRPPASVPKMCSELGP